MLIYTSRLPQIYTIFTPLSFSINVIIDGLNCVLSFLTMLAAGFERELSTLSPISPFLYRHMPLKPIRIILFFHILILYIFSIHVFMCLCLLTINIDNIIIQLCIRRVAGYGRKIV